MLVSPPEMDCAHCLFINPCQTVRRVLILLDTSCARLGAISVGAVPCIHRSSQNKAVLPSLIMVYVEALKKA